MRRRHAHFVGSIPFENEETAMRELLEALGSHLISCPDGEVGKKSELYKEGDRLGWIQTPIQRCVNNTEAFDIKRDAELEPRLGLVADYDKGWILRPKYGPKELASHISFGYDEFFEHSYPIFKRLREETGNPNVKFQVGIPTGFDIALAAFDSLPLAIRYQHAFADRIAFECAEIMRQTDDEVIFQIEAVIPLGMAVGMPGFMTPLLVRPAVSLAAKLPEGARIGVHLCLGDLNHKSSTRLILKKIAGYSNIMVKKWPEGRPLTYVHFPLAEAATPPPTDPDFYSTLSLVKLPADTRFIAGFIHEGLNDPEHVVILNAVERAVERTVDVACSCGLGRRERKMAEELIGSTARLLGSDLVA